MRFYKQRLETLRKLKELNNREDLNIVELKLKEAIKDITDVDFFFFKMDFFLPSQSIIFSKNSEIPVIFLGNLGVNYSTKTLVYARPSTTTFTWF